MSDQNGSGASVSFDEFLGWSSERVAEQMKVSTVVLATGGSSRWYLFEHGNMREGYSKREQFEDYGNKTTRRVIEIASMMLNDGVKTVFAPGFAGGQGERDETYVNNLKWGYSVLINDQARQAYEELSVGPVFRGNWASLFGRLGADDLLGQFDQSEQEIGARTERKLVWYVQDDLIPASVLPYVQEHLARHGSMPSREVLVERYYGWRMERVDILIGNNKPGVGGMAPPLLELGELFFTVSPTPYLDIRMWRRILYDQMFARKRHYREYGTIEPEAISEMQEFYRVNREKILGIGVYEPRSQTWRPEPYMKLKE